MTDIWIPFVSGVGVTGTSKLGTGVSGSGGLIGVSGSGNDNGVSGTCDNGVGASGTSKNNVGVSGTGTTGVAGFTTEAGLRSKYYF